MVWGNINPVPDYEGDTPPGLSQVRPVISGFFISHKEISVYVFCSTNQFANFIVI